MKVPVTFDADNNIVGVGGYPEGEFTVRELEEDDPAVVAYLNPPLEPAKEDEVLYEHENRLRALEGQPPLTLEEFTTTKLRR